MAYSADGNTTSHNWLRIERRGIFSGFISVITATESKPTIDINSHWANNHPIYLPKAIVDELPSNVAQIECASRLYESILKEIDVENVLDEDCYRELFGDRFQILSSRFDESDPQEIVSIDFDVMQDDKLIHEDIWMRVSWLSYHDEDESLRFRFSFGMENYEDVSTDPERQSAAAELSQCIFPESRIITENKPFIAMLQKTLDIMSLKFVERIIYFNAPNGGAQFHHDAEKGHLGVVYAQLTGRTFWLSLSKLQLVDQIAIFVSNPLNLQELRTLIKDKQTCVDFETALKVKSEVVALLDDPTSEAMAILLNESTTLFKQLLEAGHGYVLSAGDCILLPQTSLQNCAWHSVFSLGGLPGEALSFAIKPG